MHKKYERRIKVKERERDIRRRKRNIRAKRRAKNELKGRITDKQKRFFNRKGRHCWHIFYFDSLTQQVIQDIYLYLFSMQIVLFNVH